MNEFIMNKETGKIELYFDKQDYLNLSDEQKREINSNFLFSRKKNAWVSRAKFPNLYRAETVAKKLGLSNGGNIGETLSFREQMERKAERAEARAERYDMRSTKALENGKALQKPIDDRHGDIAFFTQPNINSSAGRAFTNRRNRMFAAWEKGFEEFRKSEYYAERAETARTTASMTKPTDKGFIDRRIKDAEKTIRAQKKNLESYHKTLEKIQSGEIITHYNGSNLTEEEVNSWISTAEEIIEQAISKSIYYHECLEEVGGIEFSKENIKAGYVVELAGHGECRVVRTGKVNITYEILTGGAAGAKSRAAYAEIKSIVSTDIEEAPSHPFKVGESFTVKEWDGTKFADKTYTVTKVTPKRVTLQSGTCRAISRKPHCLSAGNGEYSWTLKITDCLDGIVCKKEGIN